MEQNLLESEPLPGIVQLTLNRPAARNALDAGLIGALVYFGLDTIGATDKREMQTLVLNGGPWSVDEREKILNYCESDVLALGRLLPAMLPQIDLPRALIRGRYMAAAAAMERPPPWLTPATMRVFPSHSGCSVRNLMACSIR